MQNLPYCYKYPRPAVTVDLVVLCRPAPRARPRVLLVRRKRDPFAGRLALPGGFLDLDEPAEQGALRELREETGLDLHAPLRPLGAYSAPGRDPRGRTISLAFLATLNGPTPATKGADDAESAAWFEVAALEPLAFDHDAILKDALASARRPPRRQ